jgi:signal transduction histidine kinase/CheY-like chemotaxis protein
MWTALQAGREWQGEFRNRRKNGELFWETVSISCIRDEKGRITHFVAVLEDVTQRKLDDQAMRDLNTRLEVAIVEARRHAAAAAEASAAKSQFLANMSHEIRTPMNGIMGMSSLLLETKLDEDQRYYTQTVQSCSESLLNLINDILDFSKIEAGRMELDEMDFDLRALVDDLSSLLAVRAHAKNLELVCAIDPDVPIALRGDAGRLRQILTNLAHNAIKFSHEGDVLVRVSLLDQTADAALLRFMIRDQGIGIAPDKREQLFTSFYQVDASTTRSYGGTGLGLAISQKLVHMMGGAIGVESELGKGSLFWFEVRFVRHAGLDFNSPPAELRGIRTLIVDDNATNREVLRRRLESWGMQTSEAPDGPAALDELAAAIAREQPYDLAILDMQMPDMDGLTLARAIRADARFAGSMLVLMSSLGQFALPAGMHESIFAARMSKPVRHLDLHNSLQGLFAPKHASAPSALAGTDKAPPAQGAPARQARVLLAEDNLINQRVAQLVLQKLGHQVDTVTDGRAVLHALETASYDLVLMDVQMPVMDGLEATRRIRDPQSAVRDHHIPIVAMTAHAMTGDAARCRDAGMNDYLSKPVRPDTLAEVLRKWL